MERRGVDCSGGEEALLKEHLKLDMLPWAFSEENVRCCMGKRSVLAIFHMHANAS